MSTANHYVNKKELIEQIVAWQESVAKAAEAGKPEPRIPDTIGKAIIEICTRMGTRPNFRDYTYIDEMISDAIATCVKGIRNFNPAVKGRAGEVNPFGYLSLIAWRAFLGRIETEKKLHKAKMAAAFDPTVESFTTNDGDHADNYESVNSKVELLDFYYRAKIHD